MLERFTIDALAEEIERQIEVANPDAKLVHRAFRKGRRDGRKQHDSTTMKRFLLEAVALATSKIAEDYVDARKALQRQVVGGTAQFEALEVQQPPAVDSVAAVSAGTAIKGNVTQAALAERLAGSIAAEATRVRQQRADLAQSVAIARAELGELSGPYLQKIESAHRTGGLMWARYCNGHLLGGSRRAPLDDSKQGPDPDIEFATPAALFSGRSKTDSDSGS